MAPAAASETVPADVEPPDALFDAAAAPSPDELDPYDWPTQAQLDQFVAAPAGRRGRLDVSGSSRLRRA